ncbi:MAG: murein biosynthesis integral membrane protein MurJ [Propionibacteriaceae bacterium]
MSETEIMTPEASSHRSKLLRASSIMAAGTLASRILGLVRNAMAGAVLSTNQAQADIFAIAISLPTMLYYLFAGGTLNTVLVPQIVRAVKNDDDSGEAFINRMITAFGIAILAVTVIAMIFSDPLVWITAHKEWHSPQMTAWLANMQQIALLMMPQVFFWGAFFMLGQVLNALDRFGPMMWAPVANNIVQIAMFGFYWFMWGSTGDHSLPFNTQQIWVIVIGTTLGIAVQAVLLGFYLTKAGYRYRPRFDLRGSGLGHTVRIAKWILIMVVIAQLANLLVTKIVSGGTAGTKDGAGLAMYQQAMLIWMMPHGLITVSLMTALLPAISRMVDDNDVKGVGFETMRALKITATIMMPVTIALAVLAFPIMKLIYGYGAGAAGIPAMAWTLIAYLVGFPFFTAIYVLSRTFFAYEDTKTVMYLNIAYDLLQVVFAFALVRFAPSHSWFAPACALGYSIAHIPVLPFWFKAIKKQVPSVSLAEMIRHWTRVGLATVPAAVAAWIVMTLATRYSAGKLMALISLTLVGAIGLAVFYAGAKVLHITEVTDLVDLIKAKLGLGKATPLSDAIDDESITDEDVENSIPRYALYWDDTQTAIPVFRDEPRHVTKINNPIVETTASSPTIVVNRDDTDILLTEEIATARQEPSAYTLPSGYVLGERYRLDEHLMTRQEVQTWQAFDSVLARPVLIHILKPHAANSDLVLGAARRSAIATDSRFLRVLDAVPVTGDEIGSYIVGEYVPGSSLETLLTSGPFSALESGWIVRDIADALISMHAQGIYHERLNLDTIVISRTGNAKIVGLLTEAVLHPLPEDSNLTEADREARDVESLGKILFALLTAHWPGSDAYGLPAAPISDGSPVTPNTVNSGVSPALNQVCDQILSHPPSTGATPLRSVNDIYVTLSRILGSADASASLERRLRTPVLPESVRNFPDHTVIQSIDSTITQPAHQSTAVIPETSEYGYLPIPAPAESSSVIFDDDEYYDDDEYGENEETYLPERRRNKGRGLILGLLALILVTFIIGIFGVIQAKKNDSSANPAAPSATAKLRTIVAGRDFDPEGSRTENTPLVPKAFDGDAASVWQTERYPTKNPQSLEIDPKTQARKIKTGVGIILDLGEAVPVSKVSLQLTGEPTGIQILVADPTAAQPPMDAVASWKKVAEQEVGAKTDLAMSGDIRTRYVLVLVTSLPVTSDGAFQASINEVQVSG